MTDREVMKMALEAQIAARDCMLHDGVPTAYEHPNRVALVKMDVSIAAIRSALAQPEPMLNGLTEAQTSATASVAGLSQPEPKPMDKVYAALHDEIDNRDYQIRLLSAERDLHRAKAEGDYWAWADDGHDDLASMGNRMPVMIHASTLRRLIAAPEPQGEPVAWAVFVQGVDGVFNLRLPAFFSEQEAKDEAAYYKPGTVLEVRPLYTHPQRDLSDEEILAAYDSAGKMRAFYCEADLLSAARAILAARKA